MNPMYHHIDSRLQSSAYLVITAHMSALISRDLKYTFHKNMVPNLSDAHQAYSREIIKLNKAEGHK